MLLLFFICQHPILGTRTQLNKKEKTMHIIDLSPGYSMKNMTISCLLQHKPSNDRNFVSDANLLLVQMINHCNLISYSCIFCVFCSRGKDFSTWFRQHKSILVCKTPS
ncbi:unnamed protein product [Musa acuminata subsp. burmannicoides]